jgi:hypothetical protein
MNTNLEHFYSPEIINKSKPMQTSLRHSLFLLIFLEMSKLIVSYTKQLHAAGKCRVMAGKMELLKA